MFKAAVCTKRSARSETTRRSDPGGTKVAITDDVQTNNDHRPLSIAHVLTSLCIGGGERVALMLASDQARAGHQVAVVSFEEPAGGALLPQFERAGVAVWRFPKRPGFDVRLAAELSTFFRRSAFDVVHTHNPLPLIYAALPARTAGSRVVHTKHGPHPDRAHRLWLRRLGGLAVDAFVAVSEDTASFARKLREVHDGKLHVLRNATDLDAFRPDADRRGAKRAAWGLDDRTLIVGTVGRMAPVKNHALLLRAMAPLLGPERRLFIAGDGPERENTEALASELGIATWVRFLGAVDDVPEVLSAFDVFALPSHVEGLPLAATEAMASALPVVATRVGGVPKVVEHGQTGLLVADGDETALREALGSLLRNRTLRDRFGEAGRRRAERDFASTRMLHEYMQLYRPDGVEQRRAA